MRTMQLKGNLIVSMLHKTKVQSPKVFGQMHIKIIIYIYFQNWCILNLIYTNEKNIYKENFRYKKIDMDREYTIQITKIY